MQIDDRTEEQKAACRARVKALLDTPEMAPFMALARRRAYADRKEAVERWEGEGGR